MLKDREIVCLSTQDWNGLWTRKQRFMEMFARGGNRVLYIETPVHLLGLDVLPHDLMRFTRFRAGPREVEKNLYVATLPILLPFFQMSHAINAVNQILVRRMLRLWMKHLSFHKPLLWMYTPFSEAIVDAIEHGGSVYECVDEFRAAKGFVRSSTVGAMEDSLLKKVDVTIVTQENLYARRAAICRNTFCVPNGADTELFQTVACGDVSVPDAIERLPRPRLAFVGHIQYWIDLGLIGFLAKRRPGWSFVMIGPVGPLADMKPLKGLSNVHLLGRQPQAEIPQLLKGVDVCLNPYFTGELADHCSPLKLYEYMAAGKPIVSSTMPEAKKFPDDVRIGHDYDGFLKLCDDVISTLPESADIIKARLARAEKHSWKNRFFEVNRILEGILVPTA